MEIRLTYGCMIFMDSIAVHEIYGIDIDEKEKSIGFNDITNFILANISNWSDVEECGYIPYDENDCLQQKEIMLIKNGKLVYKGDENYE